MALALIIAVPVAVVGVIWAWCLCRMAGKPTPKPTMEDRYRRSCGVDEIRNRSCHAVKVEQEGRGEREAPAGRAGGQPAGMTEVGPRRHCPKCGTSEPFGPAEIVLEGQASWWYLQCRRCGHIWVVAMGGGDE